MNTILVAFDDNRVIGDQGKIPWHIPEDLHLFKQRTMGHAIVMGAKTFQTLPPNGLPGRLNIVLHRPPSPFDLPFVGHYTAEEGVVHLWEDIMAAIGFVKVWGMTKRGRNEDDFIIGGGQIYKSAMEDEVVDKILVSKIHGTHNGDVTFPYIPPERWVETVLEKRDQFDIVQYERR